MIRPCVVAFFLLFNPRILHAFVTSYFLRCILNRLTRFSKSAAHYKKTRIAKIVMSAGVLWFLSGWRATRSLNLNWNCIKFAKTLYHYLAAFMTICLSDFSVVKVCPCRVGRSLHDHAAIYSDCAILPDCRHYISWWQIWWHCQIILGIFGRMNAP